MAVNASNPITSQTKPKDNVTPHDNPAYKKLSRINGDINKMTKDQMKEKLANLHLDTRGQKDVLKKRLKSYFKRKYISRPAIAGQKPSYYSYYVVIDFEATCDENSHNYPHEIIEFPAVLVNSADGSVVDEFHSFVRPTNNAHLTEFCKTLTNITQEQVNAAATFPDVLQDMESWMNHHCLGRENRFAVVTDGPWDMSRFLYMQCVSSNVRYPRWAKRWVNIRKVFCNAYHVKRAGVSAMLEILGLAFNGHPHSGIDDARNIARILAQLITDGCNIYENERLVLNSSVAADVESGAEVVVLQRDEVDSVENDDAEEAHTADDSSLQQKCLNQNDSGELNSQPVSPKQVLDDTVNCGALLKHLSV